MPRRLLAASASVLAAVALVACSTPAPQQTGAAPQLTPSATPTAPPSGGGPSTLPGCDAIAGAMGALLDGLVYDEATSTTNTADEAYEQRVCVFVSPDAETQLGVTLAAIPFQQTELDSYATLPNAIADDRLTPYGGVLQTFAAGDPTDGHLDSSLYLFDSSISITIQGISESGSTVETLPQLTVPTAIDAAFAVRALID